MIAVYLIITVVSLFAVYGFWFMRRSRSLLTRWAERNGYMILRAELHDFWLGPMLMRRSKGQTDYRVMVTDRAGDTHTGIVRCGTWWLGILSDEVSVVQWDG